MAKFDAVLKKTYNFSQVLKEVISITFLGVNSVERLSSLSRGYSRIGHFALSAFFLGTLAFSFSGCKVDAGFQGGLVPDQFQGITSIKGISPDSVKASWKTQSGANSYNIYSASSNTKVLSTSNSTVIFQPDSPRVSTTAYRYSVTAVVNGSEVGDRTNYITTYLNPHFSFKDEATVAAMSDTSVKISWASKWPTATMKIYSSERLATGQVNYGGFLNPKLSNSGDTSIVITGLTAGHEYCFVGVASYEDNTNDGPDGTPFTNDTATAMTAWSNNAGSFYGSKVYLSQKCVRTTSSASISIANVKVYSPQATLSLKPTFYVQSSAANIETAIYRVDANSYTSTYIGKRANNGTIQSAFSMDPGKYQFYAITTKTDDTAKPMSRIEINMNGSTPASETARQWLYIRNFTTPVAPANEKGFLPEKLQGGKGPQRAGSGVAMGDFNCDGKMDIAVGSPDYMTTAQDGRPAKLGKVVIYYDFTTGTPSTSTKTQTVMFDITGQYGDLGRNLQLGSKLYVTNFNNDSQETNQKPTSESGVTGRSTEFKCDDLVIGSNLGPAFVLYGKRRVTSSVSNGNDDGYGAGLNYTNSTGFSINPTSSCDPVSSVCQPGAYIQVKAGNANLSQDGYFVKVRAITAGDYNGDGYPDLAMSTYFLYHLDGVFLTGIWVMRGSLYGLIPPESGANGSFSQGPMASFPALDKNSFLPAVDNYLAEGRGNSLGTIANAYYDPTSKRVRDLLMVGDTTGAKVFVCKATGDATSSTFSVSTPNGGIDPTAWDCTKTFSFMPSAMASVKNALRYSPQDLCAQGNVIANTSSSEDCVANAAVVYNNAVSPPTSTQTNNVVGTRLGMPGAVAIGNGSNIVRVYYAVANPPVTNSPTNCAAASAGRDRNGCYLNNYMSSLFDSTTTVASNPCSANGSAEESCSIQALTHPGNIDGGFSSVISTFSGNKQITSSNQAKDTLLGVAAPFKSVTIGATTYINVGTVQVYQQNSFYDTDPAIAKNGVSRYSDGFSNTMTFSLDYSKTPMSNVFFGLGGIAGGPSGGPSSIYNANSDIVVGAPGYTACTVANGCTNGAGGTSIYDNGAAFTYFSHGGTYRNYQTCDQNSSQCSNSSPSAWHSIDYNNSQENSVKYHMAVSLGDIVHTGSDSVAARVNQGSTNKIRLWNGSTTSVALTYDKDFQVPGDTSAGIRVVPIGKIANSQYPALLITGKESSYLYFSGVTGLFFGTPSANSTGGNPRKLSREGIDPLEPYLDFSDSQMWNTEVSGDPDTQINNLVNFASGDFNGDGKGDFAIGFNTQSVIADGAAAGGYTPTAGYGRVFVFYGGGDNGIQTQPDTLGGYKFTTTQFATHNGVSDVQPCDSTGSNCKIQMLYGPSTNTTFGRSLASVPIGTCTVPATATEPAKTVTVHALAVSSATSSAGTYSSKIYYFTPKCLASSGTGSKSGLGFPGTGSISEVPITASTSSTGLGLSMVPVTKMMGVSATIQTHLMVTESYFLNSTTKSYKLHVVPVNTTSSSISGATSGPCYKDASTAGPSISANSIGSTNNVKCGGLVADYSSMNMLTGISYDVGFGVGSTAVGDINGDGYHDFAVSFSKLPRRDGGSIVDAQGAIAFLFGSANGLQAKNGSSTIEPARDAVCYKDSATSGATCNPTLLYLPTSTSSSRDGAYDRIMISPYSALNFGSANDNLGSLLIGSPNRDTNETDTTQRILNAGEFYVLP